MASSPTDTQPQQDRARRGWLLLAVPLVALVALGPLIYTTVLAFEERQAAVGRTRDVLTALDAYVAALMDAETTRRQAVLTRNPNLFALHEAAVVKVPELALRLEALTLEQPQLAEDSRALSALGRQRMEKLLEVRRAYGDSLEVSREAALTSEWVELLARVRALSASIRSSELAVLEERERSAAALGQAARFWLVLAEAVAAGLLGLVLWRMRAALLRTEQARAALSATVSQEVNARQAVEQSLQETAQSMQLLVEGVVDATIVRLDHNGTVLGWNAGAQRLFGRHEADAVGQPWSVFFVAGDAAAPDLLAQAQHTGRATFGAEMVGPTGKVFTAEASLGALRDGDGTLRGFAWLCQDVTQRQLALREAARIAQRLDSLITVTQDAVVFMDRQGRIARCNPAAERIFGHPPGTLVGQKVTVLMAEPYAAQHDAYVEHHERTGETKAIGRIRMVTGRKRSGEVFPLELSVARIPDEEEVPYAAFVRDVSDRAALERQLLERERLATVGTMAAKLAHEVGNPLNGMSLQAQLMKRNLAKMDKPPESLTTGLARIMDEIERLRRLLEEFRAMSRRQSYRFTQVVLGDVVAGVLDADAEDHRSRQVTVSRVLPPAELLVHGDPDKLTQVVRNLTKNAVEAMVDGGALEVVLRAEGDRVVLTIVDNGCGIPDDLDVFAPFNTTKPQGTGLGLPIVQQIVAAHAGRITYESLRGKGTTFTVSLPVAGSPGAPDLVTPAVAPALPPPGPTGHPG